MKITTTLLNILTNKSVNVTDFIEKLNTLGFEAASIGDVIDITIPYNRQDCMSVFGILYEVCKNYQDFLFKLKVNKVVNKNISVEILDKKFCPLYSGIVINDIKYDVKLPDYIKFFLSINDIKSINLIVDIINYVTLLTGQPFHGYDLSFIGKKIILDKVETDTFFYSINNEKIKIYKGTHVIKSNDKIISLPGIIGAYESRVKYDSTSIFLESAYFVSDYIKVNCDKTNIVTDSAKRFINNINCALTVSSLNYLSKIIYDIFDVKLTNIKTVKNFNNLPKKKKIIVKNATLFSIIGSKLSKKNIIYCISKMNLIYKIFNTKIIFDIPYYRNDLEIEANIISRIINFHGYNNIIKAPLKLTSFEFKHTYDFLLDIKNLLKNEGFVEIITYSFVNLNIEKFFDVKKTHILIKNPLSEKINIMRTTMFQGLLGSLSINLNRQNYDVKLFEIGNIYFYNEEFNIINENVLSIAFTNKEKTIYSNFFEFKNILEAILSIIYRNNDVLLINKKYNFFDEYVSTDIFIGTNHVGFFGSIDRKILEIFSIKQNVYFLSIKLVNKLNSSFNFYQELSKYPISTRDLSIIVDMPILYNDILSFIRSMNLSILIDIFFIDSYIFDINKKKSITIRLKFQSYVDTLLDKYINIAMDLVQQKIIKFLKAEIKLK